MSAIAVVVASINAGARGLYLLSQHGILHESVYVFVALLASGFIRFLWQKKNEPNLVSNINNHLDEIYDSYEEERIKNKSNLELENPELPVLQEVSEGHFVAVHFV